MSNPKTKSQNQIAVGPDIDALHIINTRGAVVAWIDETGAPKGTLDNGGSNSTAFQGNPVSTTPPQIGQVMKWDGVAWIPQTISASGINFSDAEIPTGITDGFNLDFTLSNSPGPPASLQLFRNGTLLTAGQDYTLSVSTITFSNAPMNGDILEAFYRF